MSEQATNDATSDAQRLGISAELLELLVCPVDHGALEAVEEGLRCTSCGRVYPVRDGIPSMVTDAS
jgi:uncharacterized protein YbaR (Trm112 family)